MLVPPRIIRQVPLDFVAPYAMEKSDSGWPRISGGASKPLFDEIVFKVLLEKCPHLAKWEAEEISARESSETEHAGRLTFGAEGREKGPRHRGRDFREPEPVHPPQPEPLRRQQEYLNKAPQGIHLDSLAQEERYAAVRIADVEQGWNLKHEELVGESFPILFGENHQYRGHGTAVLGILKAAGKNGIGGTGIVHHKVQIGLASEFSKVSPDPENLDVRYSTALAIGGALNSGFLQPGDILLIQSQVRTKEGYLLPVEVVPVTRAVIECAYEHFGVLVIEAAGNGGLDISGYVSGSGDRPFDPKGDRSGAIIVGAAKADETHAPMFFSNYGPHVSCFAWGEDVTTCGDGETSEEIDDYRSDFGGTSAAAAIVAGVAAVVQSIARGRGKPLTAPTLRKLLIDRENGTTTPESHSIGVMPDLEKLIRALK